MKLYKVAWGLLCIFALTFQGNAHCSEYTYPRNKKVLIYAPGDPYWNGGWMSEIATSASTYFNPDSTKFFDPNTVTSLNDDAASLEAVRSFGDYGTIVINTHGGLFSDGLLAPRDQATFRTGTIASFSEMYTNILDLLNSRVGISRQAETVDDDGSEFEHLVVFPSFLQKYVGSLENTFFYLGYCHGLENDSMWDVLRAKGVSVAFGFDEAVFPDHDLTMFDALMQDALLPDNSTSRSLPLTTLEAYNNIPEPDRYDPDPEGENGYFTMKKNGVKGDNFIFMDQPYDYILVTISGATGSPMSFVWDAKNNRYASILQDDGVESIFPVDTSNISSWISNTVDIGQNLYTQNRVCSDRNSFISSCEAAEPSNGCYVHGVTTNTFPGDVCLGCAEEIKTTSICTGVNGEQLENDSRAELYHLNNFDPDAYCPCNNIINLNKFDVIRGTIYNIENNIDINSTTAFLVRQSTESYSNSVLTCDAYSRDISYTSMTYSMHTPLGLLASWPIYKVNNMVTIQFESPENLTIAEDKLLGEYSEEEQATLKSSTVGVYSKNVIAQLFTAEGLKNKLHRPCGHEIFESSWIGPEWWWETNPCPDDYNLYENVPNFSILASVDYFDSTEHIDPRLLSRNAIFEDAINSLYEKFKNSCPLPTPDQLVDYNFTISVRR